MEFKLTDNIYMHIYQWFKNKNHLNWFSIIKRIEFFFFFFFKKATSSYVHGLLLSWLMKYLFIKKKSQMITQECWRNNIFIKTGNGTPILDRRWSIKLVNNYRKWRLLLPIKVDKLMQWYKHQRVEIRNSYSYMQSKRIQLRCTYSPTINLLA